MDKLKKKQECQACGAIFAASALAVVVGIVAIVLGGIAIGNYNDMNGPRALYVSGPLPSSPFVVHLAQAAAPLAMSVPLNTLSPGRIHRVWSTSAQPHTLTLQGGATWDGVHTVATWGGAIGDGLVFEFLDSTKVGVHAVKGVVFS